MRVALVHDYLVQFGGAERVLLALTELFPDAPIYTLLTDAQCVKFFPQKTIRASILNHFPKWIKKRRRWLLPFLPGVMERFDFSEFDLVISSSSAFAKNINVHSKTVHICYCHAPSRFLWDYHAPYLHDIQAGIVTRFFAAVFLKSMRRHDQEAARRVHFWIANAKKTQAALLKQYGVSSTVIYPPIAEFAPGNAELKKIILQDYFLVVARLVPYKKIHLIVDAFNALKLPLVIVGDGPERERLQRSAGKNIVFTGFLPDDELGMCYREAKAFIMAHEEDFGLAAVEAMSFGKPVLAFKKGGALEWMEEGKTGEFFSEESVQGLIEGVARLTMCFSTYRASYIATQASLFTKRAFQKAWLDYCAKIGVIHSQKEN